MNGDGDQATPVQDDAGAAPFVAVGRRWGAVATAAVLAAAGVVLLSQATLLDLGSLSLPGPGFVPVALSLALILLAGIIAVRDWQGDDGAAVGLGYRDVVIVFAAMLAVPPLFEPLGAYLTLGLFAAVLLVLVARTSVAVAVAAAALGMAGCWGFFGVGLGLQLPAGAILERIGL